LESFVYGLNKDRMIGDEIAISKVALFADICLAEYKKRFTVIADIKHVSNVEDMQMIVDANEKIIKKDEKKG